MTIPCIVDELDDDGRAIARSKADAPDIDGLVFVEAGHGFAVGDFAEVEITASDEHDLYGRVVA
jgi:ribosomal protein S12 methylthiotransferase